MNHIARDAMAVIALHQRHTRHRLSDKILLAFHQAFDQADFEVAEQLLNTLETMTATMGLRHAQRGSERRRVQENVVAAHERLWHLRHPDIAGGR